MTDDDDDTRRLLKHIVQTLGFEVVELGSGVDLMRFIGTFPFGPLKAGDIIISDIRMPQVTGIDALLEIKRRALPLSVILISAYADRINRELAKAGKAVALLEKPLAIDKLVPLLDELDNWS